MSASVSALAPELRAPCDQLIMVATAAGVNPQLTSTLRTHSEQLRLYTRFRLGLSEYPAAPPGRSAHEFGYAFDLILRAGDRQDQEDLGQVWQAWGGVWHTSDRIHFEYPGWQSLVQPSADRRPSGGLFYTLADLLSGFVPYLGEAQLADTVFRALHGQENLAEWYLQHPAEAIRDILGSAAEPTVQ